MAIIWLYVADKKMCSNFTLDNVIFSISFWFHFIGGRRVRHYAISMSDRTANNQ